MAPVTSRNMSNAASLTKKLFNTSTTKGGKQQCVDNSPKNFLEIKQQHKQMDLRTMDSIKTPVDQNRVKGQKSTLIKDSDITDEKKAKSLAAKASSANNTASKGQNSSSVDARRQIARPGRAFLACEDLSKVGENVAKRTSQAGRVQYANISLDLTTQNNENETSMRSAQHPQQYKTESLERILGSQAESYFRQIERTMQMGPVNVSASQNRSWRQASMSQSSRVSGKDSNMQVLSLTMAGIAEIGNKKANLSNTSAKSHHRHAQTTQSQKQATIIQEPRLASADKKSGAFEIPNRDRIVAHRRIDLICDEKVEPRDAGGSFQRGRSTTNWHKSESVLSVSDQIPSAQKLNAIESPQRVSLQALQVSKPGSAVGRNNQMLAISRSSKSSFGFSANQQRLKSQSRQSAAKDWVICLPNEAPQVIEDSDKVVAYEPSSSIKQRQQIKKEASSNTTEPLSSSTRGTKSLLHPSAQKKAAAAVKKEKSASKLNTRMVKQNSGSQKKKSQQANRSTKPETQQAKPDQIEDFRHSQFDQSCIEDQPELPAVALAIDASSSQPFSTTSNIDKSQTQEIVARKGQTSSQTGGLKRNFQTKSKLQLEQQQEQKEPKQRQQVMENPWKQSIVSASNVTQSMRSSIIKAIDIVNSDDEAAQYYDKLTSLFQETRQKLKEFNKDFDRGNVKSDKKLLLKDMQKRKNVKKNSSSVMSLDAADHNHSQQRMSLYARDSLLEELQKANGTSDVTLPENDKSNLSLQPRKIISQNWGSSSMLQPHRSKYNFNDSEKPQGKRSTDAKHKAMAAKESVLQKPEDEKFVDVYYQTNDDPVDFMVNRSKGRIATTKQSSKNTGKGKNSKQGRISRQSELPKAPTTQQQAIDTNQCDSQCKATIYINNMMNSVQASNTHKTATDHQQKSQQAIIGMQNAVTYPNNLMRQHAQSQVLCSPHIANPLHLVQASQNPQQQFVFVPVPILQNPAHQGQQPQASSGIASVPSAPQFLPSPHSQLTYQLQAQHHAFYQYPQQQLQFQQSPQHAGAIFASQLATGQRYPATMVDFNIQQPNRRPRRSPRIVSGTGSKSGTVKSKTTEETKGCSNCQAPVDKKNTS